MVNYLRYAWGSLMINQVGAGAALPAREPCPPGPPASDVPPITVRPALRTLPHASNAQFEGVRNVPAYGATPVLDYYSLQHASKWAWLAWELLFVGVFLAAALAALVCVQHQRR